MKTFLFAKSNMGKWAIILPLLTLSLLAKAQTVTVLSDGLKFNNPQLQSGTDLQAGAKYLFSGVITGVDAVVVIDSLINGAEVTKLDDNSNGTGYKDAFQPAIKSGNVIGQSYAVFSINFYNSATTTPVLLKNVNATALDLDGNSTLKEFARINIGAGATMAYMSATADISVSQLLPGNFLGQNILGIERPGIDTLSYNNMYTASNSNISSFSVKYGTTTTVPTGTARQFSLFMKGFNYPGNTLPVKLASFTATLNNNKADLKWTTATEINVSHFAVEKSTDGINFTEAGVVFAYGNTTNKTNYSFSDNLSTDQASIIYYRLRSVDIDAKSEYSDTRVIRISKQSDSKISILTYPNPVTSELRITIPASWQNKKVVYELFNANGQIAKRAQATASSQTETLKVSNLATGLYIVRVTFDGQVAQQKIIKN